jgi:hypothetical protein
MAAFFEQAPQAVLDYTIDWTAWLNGDTISNSIWAYPGLTLAPLGTTVQSGAIATVWLTGGTPGTTYKVRNQIITVNGRTERETFDLLVKDH